MSKSLLIINTPKSCEECSLCVAVQGKHYCPGKGTYIQNGERDCACPLVAVPEKLNPKEANGAMAMIYINGWNDFADNLK